MVCGMTLRGKTTFAPNWHKIDQPVEYSIKIKIKHSELKQGGYQYFSWEPVGFSAGLCGFGCSRTDHIIDLMQLKG